MLSSTNLFSSPFVIIFLITAALYDSGLSNSLRVSVRVSQGPNGSNASFTFVVRKAKDLLPLITSKFFCFLSDSQHPSLVPCSNLAYLLVLETAKYHVPRLEGPFQIHLCQSKYQIPVYNLLTDCSYSAYVIAYNSSLSLKSSILQFSKYFSNFTVEVKMAVGISLTQIVLVFIMTKKLHSRKSVFHTIIML